MNKEIHVCRNCQNCQVSYGSDPYYDRCLVYNKECSSAKRTATCDSYEEISSRTPSFLSGFVAGVFWGSLVAITLIAVFLLFLFLSVMV